MSEKTIHSPRPTDPAANNSSSIFATLEELRRLADLSVALPAPPPVVAPQRIAATVELPPAPAPVRWADSVKLVRETAARFKAIHQAARDVAQEARGMIENARAETEAADARARAAVEAAEAMAARLGRAEKLIGLMKQRLDDAEARAENAENALVEFQKCLHSAFDDLR